MCTSFWDRKGALLSEVLPQRETINAASYFETLRNLCRVIQNKRHSRLSSGIGLLHDNTRPYASNQTQDLIRKFGWEVDHSPYIPDFAPSYFRYYLP